MRTTNTGGAGNDTLSGTEHYSERLIGGDGNDTLTAVGYWDVLDGGSGNDTLKVNHNHTSGTTFIGGQGNDTVTGTYYNDTYLFKRGDGADTISDHSAGYNHTDTLKLGEGITEQDLWFQRDGYHLLMQVLGDGGSVRINDWYRDPHQRIETIQLNDGQAAVIAQVDLLVQAMAAFAPPPPGQVSYTAEQQAALAPVIAAAWG